MDPDQLQKLQQIYLELYHPLVEKAKEEAEK
jgi:hypothetical protein